MDFTPLNTEVEKAKEEESRVKSEYETLMLEFTRLSTLIANEEKNRDSFALKTADVKPEELSETMIKLDGYLDALKKYEDLSKRKVTAEADKTRADGKLEEVAKRGKQARESLDESKKSLSETDPDKLVEVIKQTEAFINGVTEFEKSCDEQNRHLTLEQATNGEALARVGAELGAIEESVKEIPAKPTVSLDVVAMETQTLERTYDEALSASAKAEKDKDLIIASYEKKKVISKKRQDARARYEKMHDVSSAMARGEFIAYVATEYIKDFTVTASATLSELTGGKYSLEYDEKEGEFLVTDFLSNNEKRKAKTLSGGETFLASLAMAIALSQEIARYGNFDFFFIDEGFGTLHEQALDQALEVLRRLSETSLVGLVTHRTELKEKIPVTLLVTPAEDERGSRCKIV